MELTVLDPGYENASSHHRTVNLELASALRSRGVSVKVLAASTIESECLESASAADAPVKAYFDTPFYMDNSAALPSPEHGTLAKSFEAEVTRLFQQEPGLRPENLLLHTCFSAQLQGLAAALWRLRNTFSGKLVLSMMYHPGAGLSMEAGREIVIEDHREFFRYKSALEIIERAAQMGRFEVVLAVPCESYRLIYQSMLINYEIEVHPAVCYRELPSQVEAADTDRPSVLLYLGGVKHDKGFLFAAELGAQAAKALPQLDFTFHFNTDFPNAELFSRSVDALTVAGEHNGNVKILRGNLSDYQYDALTATTDLFCMLYRPGVYRFKTSGIVWDAIRNRNANYLVSAGTWHEIELSEMKLPHLSIDYGDVDGGLQVLSDFARNQTETKQARSSAGNPNAAYLGQICRPFGDWILEKLSPAG